MPDSVPKVLATSPMPLTARTIAELTGSDESRVQAALVELAKKDVVRSVKHGRWVVRSPSAHVAPAEAAPRAHR